MVTFYTYRLKLNDVSFNLDYSIEFQNQITTKGSQGSFPLLILTLINSRELINDSLQTPKLNFTIDNVQFFNTNTSVETVRFVDNGTTNAYEYNYTYDTLNISKSRILPSDVLPFKNKTGTFKDDFLTIENEKLITPSQYYDILESVAIDQNLGNVYVNTDGIYVTTASINLEIIQNIRIKKIEVFNNILRAYLYPNIFVDVGKGLIYNKVIYRITKVIFNFSTETGSLYWIEGTRYEQT